MNYNPYDLVVLSINQKTTYGRPFEFDSEIVNAKTSTNAFGNVVKPTKLSTTCPDCGQGLIIPVRLGEPPFAPVLYSCPYCCPAPPPMSDPFINPLETGRVPLTDLDPLLQNPEKQLEVVTVSSAAERFAGLRDQLTQAPAPPEPVTKESDLMVSEETLPLLEKADGIREEDDDLEFEEFDDTEMIEDE